MTALCGYSGCMYSAAAAAEFRGSVHWKRLRASMIDADTRCSNCGAADRPMELDHRLPMLTHWHLRAEPGNCEPLCKPCNASKGATLVHAGDVPTRRVW